MPLELYLRGGIYWVRGRAADGDKYDRQSLRTSDEALAQAAVRELERQARKRRILGPDAPKLEDELTFEAATFLYTPSARDAGYLARLVRKIGKLRVKELTPEFIRQLGPQMMPAASTDTWQREIVTPVRAVINNAHALGKGPPIRIQRYSEKERVKQDVARGRQSRVPRAAGSWEWLLAFCEAAEPRDAALAWFMFRHGYRPGQSIAMTRSRDLDLQAGRARVHASKGHPAHWVDLDPEEVVMIANLPLPRNRSARDRVFYITSVSNGAIGRRWKTACKRAGIPYMKPYEAGRHGYGTEMIVRRGVDPVSAAADKWADPSMLLKTYAHPEGAADRVREAFTAGREAARTKLVQRQMGIDANALPAKRKA